MIFIKLEQFNEIIHIIYLGLFFTGFVLSKDGVMARQSLCKSYPLPNADETPPSPLGGGSDWI
jgi:hypothetical protein